MRRVAKVATFLAALALIGLPAMGQHAVSRGGSGGHSFSAPGGFGGHAFGSPGGFSGRSFSAPRGSFGPGFGSFASRGPMGFRPSPGPRQFAPQSGFARFGQARLTPGFHPGMNRPLYRGNGFAADRSRGWDGDRDHRRRRDYWNGYGYGYGYPYYYPGPIFTGYVDPWLFGPDDYDNGYGAGSGYAPDPNYGGGYAGYGNDVPAPYQNYGQQPDDSGNPYPQEYRQRPYDEQAPPQQPSSGRPAYNGGALSGSATLLPQQEVTVIFKDGRPAEQIDNYMLTSTTLTVLDVQRRQIPIDEINVDATVAANRAAGVDFRVPGGLR